MDKYVNQSMRRINWQINEQANAGLQRINGQLAFIKPDNFMFHIKLFLAITNMDKQVRIAFEYPLEHPMCPRQWNLSMKKRVSLKCVGCRLSMYWCNLHELS